MLLWLALIEGDNSLHAKRSLFLGQTASIWPFADFNRPLELLINLWGNTVY
jgi:hypothetical protein